MTTSPHKSAQLGQIHPPVNWTFSTVTARRTPGVYVTTDIGSEAMQTDTSPPTFWKLLGFTGSAPTATPIWGPMNITAESLFSGDFAALAATFGLTVRGHWRGDMGVSGTLGTGAASWANQMGSASAIAGADTNGLGVTAGLGGRAGILLGTATGYGTYTMPAQAAPATTNTHQWWIGRFLATPSGAGTIFIDSTGLNAVQIVSGQTTPAANVWLYNNGAGPTTTGVVINQWYRGYACETGSANDKLRIGANAPAQSATTNTAHTTSRTIGASSGINRGQIELLDFLELEGTLANLLLFDAAAAPQAQSWWTSAIEI
jgi:hypothetical protein